MTRTAILTAGAVILALLAIICITRHRPMIVEDLTSRSTAALLAGGIAVPAGAIVLDGRDAVLRGVEGSPIVSGRARDITAALWGVRTVRVETTPKPAAPTPKAVESKVKEVLTLNDVEFDKDSANLTATGRATLGKVAAELKQVPGSPIGIYGYTDSKGGFDYNMALSQRRADAAKAYLVWQGLPASQLSAKGFGPTKPIADNETEEGRQKNRRIEFSVKEIVVEKKEPK